MRGWTLPLEQGDDSIRDLAIDISGSLLGVHKKRPFGKIFECYRRSGLTDFDVSDPEELLPLLESLVFKHTRQELYNLGQTRDPQRANLKRRIKDTLKQPEYTERTVGSASLTLVGRTTSRVEDLTDLLDIPYNKLLELVEHAFLHDGITRGRWLRSIFDALGEQSEHRTWVKKHELISAMINVNLKYVEIEDFQSSVMSSAITDLISDAVERARGKTLDWIRENRLKTFVRKGRISEDIAQRFLMAADCYLMDLVYSSGTDKLPVYFREVTPESEHSRYLADYKHVFETTINEALKHFRDLMRGFHKTQKWQLYE